jgi:hypothetical protein
MVYHPGIRKVIRSMKEMHGDFRTVLLCLYRLLLWS